MRKLLLLFSGLLVQAASFAQDSTSTGLEQVATITILAPGVSYEHPVGKQQSLFVHPHLGISAQWGYSLNLGSYGEVIVDPALSLQYRRYYNRLRRAEKGRRIERNSGNYLAGLYTISYSRNAMWEGHLTEKQRRPIHVVGAVWGMQRNGARRFSFDVHGGVGYFYTRGTEWDDNASRWRTVRGGDATLLLDFSIGLWLGKR